MKNSNDGWSSRFGDPAGRGKVAAHQASAHGAARGSAHDPSSAHDRGPAANRAGEPIHSVFSQQMHGLRARIRARSAPPGPPEVSREASIPATPPGQGDPPAVPGSPIEPEMPENPDLPPEPTPPEIIDPPPDVVTIPVREPPTMPKPRA